MPDTPVDRQPPEHHHPGLEARVAVNEALLARMEPLLLQLVADMSATRADIAELKGSSAKSADLAELKGSMKHLPTAWMMVTTAIAAAVVVAGGVVGGVFAALRYTGHG